MVTNAIELLSTAVWPLIFSAAVLFIVHKAIAEPDATSTVLRSLTQEGGSRRKPDGLRPSQRVKSRAGRVPMTAMFAMLASAAAATPACAGRYEFDQRKTEVRFAYVMAYATQRGRFTKVSGTLDYDEAAPEKSRINATITASSLTTGEAIVDAELKGPEFFNVIASPAIAFRSIAVKPKSATTADVSGEITLNGITKPVTLKVSLRPHDNPALKYDAGWREFVATTRIQRSAFNMTKYKALVDDHVDLEIAAIVRPK